jgi:Fe-S oxidoreductase
VKARVAYHDSCLGRCNDIYDAPRDVLRSIPAWSSWEAEYWTRQRGCCGAGGAQMWMEEQNGIASTSRTNGYSTGAETIASAAHFAAMLSDGIKAESRDDDVKNMDVVELLAISCGVDEGARAKIVAEEPLDAATAPVS